MEKTKKIDFVLIILTLLLVTFGFIMIYSRTLNVLMLIKQLIVLIISLWVGFLIFKIDLEEFIKKNITLIIFLTFVLLIIPILINKIKSINTPSRWISFGYFSIQPSEFAKFSIVVFFSYWFSKKESRIFNFYDDLIVPILITFVFLILIYYQKDLSTVVLIFTFVLFSFYISHIPVLYLIYLFLFSISIFIILALISPYRANRIIAYLIPFKHPTDIGYQVIQSFKSIVGGGLFGHGIGFYQTSNSLPLSYSDYIFSAVAYDFGLLGSFIIIVIYILWGIKVYLIAANTGLKFQFLLVTNILIIIMLQSIFNISVATGLLPPTGLTLPFLSYGGSSLFINLIFIAMILKVYSERAYEI